MALQLALKVRQQSGAQWRSEAFRENGGQTARENDAYRRSCIWELIYEFAKPSGGANVIQRETSKREKRTKDAREEGRGRRSDMGEGVQVQSRVCATSNEFFAKFYALAEMNLNF